MFVYFSILISIAIMMKIQTDSLKMLQINQGESIKNNIEITHMKEKENNRETRYRRSIK